MKGITHYCHKSWRVGDYTPTACWVHHPAKVTDRWDRVKCKKCLKRKEAVRLIQEGTTSDDIPDANKMLEREFNEAQKALQSIIEAMTFTDYANGYSKYTVILGGDEIDALRKAAGLTNVKKNKKLPIVNREGKQ
jgi:hypothetical protein